MAAPKTRVERYLDHLDVLSGGVEPTFTPVESTHPQLPRVMAIGYRHMPERGMILGFTYGLSLAAHEEWRHGRPELSILMRSTDRLWVLAIAHLAESLRGTCPFAYGDTVNFGEAITPDTAMDGFVVSARAAVDAADAWVEVGEDHPLQIVGLWPTYRSEREFIHEHGLESFWKLDWDPYDPARPPAV